MVIVFDLDDTLYEELSYVRSGFLAVAKHLANRYGIPVNDSYQYMLDKLQQGRGRIFDDLLLKYAIYNKDLVKKCISIYRLHQPDIHLDEDAVFCLNNFKQYPLYIVTDGNRIVQKNKLLALGLFEKVKFCFITHCYGLKHSKPSPYCFLKICALEKVEPNKVIYIGDNPAKDFVGIKPLGFKTIRILKGQHKNISLPESFEAQLQIASLYELNHQVLNLI